MSIKKYGRKEIRKTTNVEQRLLVSWVICTLIGALIGCLLFAGIGYANKNEKVYGYVDGQGITKEITFEWINSSEPDFVTLDIPLDKEVQEFIYYLSDDYNIEFPFVIGLIESESGFRADVISATNDWGLMQINKCNHSWLSETLGVTDFTNPYENVRAGLFVLNRLFEKYEDPSKVLMAYNMGEANAARLWNQGVSQTNYSKKVISKVVEYEQQILEKRGETDVLYR